MRVSGAFWPSGGSTITMSQKLSEWVRSVNLYRVLAPTMVDIMFQHAVIENLDVTDADT